MTGWRDRVRRIADGGNRQAHYECRDCGRNLDPEHDRCPTCGGAVVVYEL